LEWGEIVKQTIVYEWNENEVDIDLAQYHDELQSHALDRAMDMIKQGYVSGDLFYEIYDPDNETELFIDGYWELVKWGDIVKITKFELIEFAKRPSAMIFVYVRFYKNSFGGYVEITFDQLVSMLDWLYDDNTIELCSISKGNLYIGQN
jgi:hypothetical protein